MSNKCFQLLVPLLVIAITAFVPILPALVSGGFPTDPYSELPVKLWAYDTFSDSGHWLGGPMPTIGFPTGGPLNNPDVFGSMWMHIGRFLPQSTAYGLMIGCIQCLNMFSIFVLAKSWTKEAISAMAAALYFGFCAAIQGYVIGGAITDMLHIWPYPMAIWSGMNAFRLSHLRWGVLAGIFFGLGFVTCPYNAVLFSTVALPLAWSLHQERVVFNSQGLKVAAVLGLSSLFIIGLYALKLQEVMSAASSQMSSELVQSTRHKWPFFGLSPDHPDRYVASLSDYMTTGKSNLIIRDSGARFYRSYTLGMLGIGIAIVGFLKNRSWLWTSILAMGILLSIGPFMSLTSNHFISAPSNPIYLAFYYVWPGTQMILEPFRYQLVATLGFCMLIAGGISVLKNKTLQLALVIGLPIEMGLFSTAPFPQPVSTFQTEEVYNQLPDSLNGGIIELPYHHKKSRLFVRQHFLNQLSHDQPIVNEVAGFLPAIFFENAFLARLMTHDAPYPVPTGRKETAASGANQLYEDGFRSLILTPSELIDAQAAQQMRTQIEAVLGAPILQDDGRIIYAFQPSNTD